MVSLKVSIFFLSCIIQMRLPPHPNELSVVKLSMSTWFLSASQPWLASNPQDLRRSIHVGTPQHALEPIAYTDSSFGGISIDFDPTFIRKEPGMVRRVISAGVAPSRGSYILLKKIRQHIIVFHIMKNRSS